MLDKLKNILESEKEKLKASIKNVKEARDGAPSAMESHHDTTRNQTEKLVVALEDELKQLVQRSQQIPDHMPSGDKVALWTNVKVKIDEKSLDLLLVIEGLGGKRIDNSQTLAVNTPLGEVLLGKQVGDNFLINDKKGEIISIN